MEATWQLGKPARRRLRGRWLPIGIECRRDGILRKGMQDVGQDQFLMLLLMMQPDLQDMQHFAQSRVVDLGHQPLDGFVDMRAERGHASSIWPRYHAPAGSPVARTSG